MATPLLLVGVDDHDAAGARARPCPDRGSGGSSSGGGSDGHALENSSSLRPAYSRVKILLPLGACGLAALLLVNLSAGRSSGAVAGWRGGGLLQELLVPRTSTAAPGALSSSVTPTAAAATTTIAAPSAPNAVAPVTKPTAPGVEAVRATCEASFHGKPCCWTQAWSCPSQPMGLKGIAVNDGTMSYHCCCTEGLWEFADNCTDELLPKTIQLPSDSFLWGEETASPERGACKQEVGKQLRGEMKDSEPELCKIPVEAYNTSDDVQMVCRQRLRWKDLAKNIRPRDCDIDPETKLMTCSRDEVCHGGHYVAEAYVKVTKNLTYDCAATCQGSLLISCCSECTKTQKNAAQWGLDNIFCEGCAEDNLNAIAKKSDCSLQSDGTFFCDSTGSCSAGVPTESCEEVHHVCDVFPCNNCDAPHLQAQCCADCLGMMCSGDPSRRMMCEGCESPPGDKAWWSSWGSLR
mmetsp:Transcript_71822/g.181519  ORF Transcript_71822/g.181519 Transcript_71822/m.181519 type:complete len:463 (-) Transcript_71822:174-1562(-)